MFNLKFGSSHSEERFYYYDLPFNWSLGLPVKNNDNLTYLIGEEDAQRKSFSIIIVFYSKEDDPTEAVISVVGNDVFISSMYFPFLSFVIDEDDRTVSIFTADK